MQRKGFPICPYYAIRAYILGSGSAKRRGRENPLRHAGSLLGGLHSGYLRPRYRLHAEAGGGCGREFPLWYSPALTAPNSRMGHGLGQTGAAKSNHQKKCRKKNKSTEIQQISVDLVRPEGFEPPAFWSVACLRVHGKCFLPRLVLFAQDISRLSCCPFRSFHREISCSGSGYGSDGDSGPLDNIQKSTLIA